MGIHRDDTEEEVCETGAIEPRSYVESIPPDTNLPVGECDCMARLYTYHSEIEEHIG